MSNISLRGTSDTTLLPQSPGLFHVANAVMPPFFLHFFPVKSQKGLIETHNRFRTTRSTDAGVSWRTPRLYTTTLRSMKSVRASTTASRCSSGVMVACHCVGGEGEVCQNNCNIRAGYNRTMFSSNYALCVRLFRPLPDGCYERTMPSFILLQWCFVRCLSYWRRRYLVYSGTLWRKAHCIRWKCVRSNYWNKHSKRSLQCTHTQFVEFVLYCVMHYWLTAHAASAEAVPASKWFHPYYTVLNVTNLLRMLVQVPQRSADGQL